MPPEPRVKRGRLEHRSPNQHGPCSSEEVAEALADRDAQIGVERLEDNHGRLARRLACCGIVVLPGQDWNEERPTGNTEELHDGGKDPDNGRRGDDGQTVAREDLSEKDCERGK